MKNIAKMFLAALVVTGFASCEDEQDLLFVNPPASFQILTPQNGESVVLNGDTPNNPALTLAWEDVDYGTPTAVSYTVQIAPNGVENAWATPVDIATSPTTFATVNMVTLNNALDAMGFEPEMEVGIDVRIKATVAGSMETYSNVITYLVTPYEGFVPLQNLYLVGNATEDNWNNNASNAPLFRDPADQNIFYYTGYFNAGGFKILSMRGSWHPQYGSVSDGVLGVSGTDGSNEPGQIMVATAGYYQLKVNIDDMTYTFEPFNASGATTYATVGITGSATPEGWPDNGIQDVTMTATATNPHLWRVSGLVLTAAEAKFRADDAWTMNWGGATPISGVGVPNGGNIMVPAGGTYEVWFNDLDMRYIFIEQ
jgi:starch-binding outer membrane protein SusE/F